VRIGVYCGDFAPEEGGGHGFVAALTGAFLAAARASGHQFTLFCEPGAAAGLTPRSKDAGVTLRPLPARGAFTIGLESLRCYSPAAHLLRRWPGRLDAAGAREGIECLWFLPGIAYEATDIPYIGTVWDLLHRQHPWFPEGSAQGQWEHRELFYARFLRRAAHLLTGTRAGAALIQAQYQVPPDRISVLPQPMPETLAPGGGPSSALAALQARPFLLYPAQFWPHKNHVNLLHALKSLEGVDLVLPGSDKGNLAHVKRTAGDLGLGQRVHFPGFVGANDLAWLYRNAVALAYPSFLGPDNLPPIEAFAYGCPVAIADYEGAAEQTGDAALRFDPADPAAMAGALRRLLEDRALGESLVARGRTLAAGRSATGYVKAVFAVLDRFEAVRRCWDAGEGGRRGP
jgi:glycosyltransferase involved in cell wall biosynthesis